MGILQARILDWVASSPGDLPNLGIEPRSPALQVDSLPTQPPGKPLCDYRSQQFAKSFRGGWITVPNVPLTTQRGGAMKIPPPFPGSQSKTMMLHAALPVVIRTGVGFESGSFPVCPWLPWFLKPLLHWVAHSIVQGVPYYRGHPDCWGRKPPFIYIMSPGPFNNRAGDKGHGHGWYSILVTEEAGCECDLVSTSPWVTPKPRTCWAQVRGCLICFLNTAAEERGVILWWA